MAKTRSERTSKKRTYKSPSGETKTEYHKRKKSKVLCAKCGTMLCGVPTSLKGKSKSEKVPNRPNAGNFCSKCSREFIKEKIIKSLGN